MRIKILLMTVVLAGLLFSLSASAQPNCPGEETTDPACFAVPMTIASGQVFNGVIPKFDSSLGTLTSVRLNATACAASTYEISSEDPFVQTWNVISQGCILVTPPVGPQLQVCAGTPEDGVDVVTGPDDEPGLFDSDWKGVDYVKLVNGTVENPVCEDDEWFFDSAADLAVFNGTAGDVLPVQMRLRANKDVRNDNGSTYEERAAVQASGIVCVEYTYLPPCPKFCINGTKINDCTGLGIEGWEICLTEPDGQKMCTTTDANGDYSFCELEPGDYTVCEDDRDGWVHLDQPCRTVTLEDQSEEGVDFLNAPLFCISGHKYNSDTGAGISGWMITLLDANGAVIANKLTGTGGYYEFCGLLPGDYTVVEETRSGWKAITPISIPVTLDCANSENNDFENQPPDLVCVCPFIIKNELYTANCDQIKEVDASKGLLANDPVGSVVLNPELITIDPKYGTIDVNADGSFVYDPTVATGRLYTGLYLVIKYSANNGFCDSKYLGVAKIQIRCK